MWRAELGLLFRRTRTRALLGVLALVPIVIAVAVRLSGNRSQRVDGPQFLDQLTHNGVFAALVGLTVTLPFFLPLAVAVVVDDVHAALAQRLTRAGMRQSACMENLDLRTPRGLDRSTMQALASGLWIRQHRNVLISGAAGIGKPTSH